jgi:hypothetical protein
LEDASVTKFQREIVGRASMAVLAIALIWGGVKCFGVAAELKADADRRYEDQSSRTRRRSSGAVLPLAAGVVLVLVGGPLLLGAVVPVSVMAKVMGRQKNVTLGEGGDTNLGRGWSDLL